MNCVKLLTQASVSAVAAGWLLASVSANAQTTPVESDGALDSIIVTAERDASDVQRTPIAINVLAGDNLERQAKNTIEDALRTVPGVAIRLSNAASNTKIAIRGIQEGGQGTEPSVSLSNDGIYQSHPGSSPNFDIARIEVLKGPQGTLYGRNATGGAVNIITNDPTDYTSGVLMAQIGNYSAMRLDGAVNIPISDTVLSRFAFTVNQRDGFLNNGAQSQDVWAVRGKLLFHPTPDLDILLAAEYDHSSGTGQGVVVAPIAQWGDDPWSGAVEPAGAYLARKASAYARVTWALPFAVLSSQTSFYRLITDSDTEIVGPSGYAYGHNTNEQFTQEFRISQPEGSLVRWQVGAFYFRLNEVTDPHAPLIDAPERSASATGLFQPSLTNAQAAAAPGTIFRRPIGPGGRQAPIAEGETSAVFGQITYPVTDEFRVTAGGRYTMETRSRQNRIFNGTGVESSQYGPYTLTSDGLTPCTATNQPSCLQEAEYNAFTYKFGVEYDVGPDSMFYADVARGFKSGGLQLLPVPSGTSTSFNPEYLQAYEAGIKNRLFDNMLQLNLDAYYYDYKDKQLIIVGPPIAPNPFPSTPTLNVGRAEVYGFEAAGDWAITANDILSASVAWTHSTVKEGAGNVMVGDALPNAPEWTERVSYEHTFDLGQNSLMIGGDVTFYSGTWIDTNKTRLDAYQPSYQNIDAHLTYELLDGDLAITAWANNLTNEAVRSAVFPGNRIIIDAPRTFGVTARAQF